MSLYALINNNIVSDISELNAEEFLEKIKHYQLIIDISDIYPQPQLGWCLDGNQLRPMIDDVTDDERDLIQQTNQREFGEKLVISITDLIGARNLKLHRENQAIDITALATQLLGVKILLEGGALKTVRSICAQLRVVFIYHTDIFDTVILELDNFLNNNGWN